MNVARPPSSSGQACQMPAELAAMCSCDSVKPSFDVSIGPRTVWTVVFRGAAGVARCPALTDPVSTFNTDAIPRPAATRPSASRRLMRCVTGRPPRVPIRGNHIHSRRTQETHMERPAVRFAPVVVLLTIVCGAAPASAQAPSAVVSIPDVTGPIPITATSYPLMTSSKLQTIVDLPKAGYLEEEFFVTGRANVYDWSADGQVAVKTPNAPYTTRIMLRRPSDARRFSGNVIVDIVNS